MKLHHCLIAASLAVAAPFASAEEITVSAAASLSNAFKDIAAQYEKQYPQSKIKLNTAGSGTLLQQVLQGAPVDVLAFADQETMDKADKEGVIDVSSRRNFAKNSLVIAAPVAGKLSVNSLKDLTHSRFERIAVSNPASVPVGRYSKAALEKAGVWQTLQPKIINTQHVRQSLDYVARGEVDVGFVYNTDAVLMKDKVKVLKQVPTDKPVSYPIAVAKQSAAQAEAKRFVQYVLSAQGQAVLNRYGFKKP
ncbi:molybdate ABC transporter substrate-binding protein [Neisseria sp. Dent CA1/247]|uniref:molybdate ABC transporter substrate-binding protein n=1 Tax=Neisseria sp. Dent CA1/247 TaxID=2912675 RepID=UPI001FD151E9|nr:molybdate ABC transporter substrate-binding protein [Neisseria sp. Dent CA1/247]UOO77768.1 molybdate ABC transporter substrate-binding protein [Neisseria sp. Dent CA1/247]